MMRAHKLISGKGIQSKLIIDSNVIIDTFDPESGNHASAMKFMDHIVKNKQLFLMPMHGWFEITCNLKKIRETKGVVPPFFDGRQRLVIEFIHIDDQFLENYKDVEIPYLKAMDHIFLVVAKKNNLQLVTSDQKMIKAGKKSGVDILKPNEWINKGVRTA